MSTVNYNDTTPAPPAGLVNIKWQSDASGNISAAASLAPNIANPGADYTATAADQIIVAIGAVSNIYLPATPVANQVIQIRSYMATPVTINGNGHNIGAAATFQLYTNAEQTLWYNPAGAGSWPLLSSSSSNWINWTPTVTASGSMTVTGLTIIDAQWQWVNSYTANFKFTLGFTLGGTASTTILVSLPTPQVVPAYPLACYSQSPGQGFAQDTLFGLMQGANFTIRNAANTNLALGVYNIYATGSYRTT